MREPGGAQTEGSGTVGAAGRGERKPAWATLQQQQQRLTPGLWSEGPVEVSVSKGNKNTGGLSGRSQPVGRSGLRR